MNERNENARDRVFAAADELYAANQRTSFPTVDAVRKKARVNMNDASTGMKEWRRTQSTFANISVPLLPSELQSQALGMLTRFWEEASKHATESLLAAQTGWDAERNESEELGRQMAAAYDAQSLELANTLQEVSRLNSDLERTCVEVKALGENLSHIIRERDEAQRALSEAIIKMNEVNKRADELHQAADYYRNDATRARSEIDASRNAHAEQVERMREEHKRELENERVRAERERQHYEEHAINATAEAAHLRGRLEALTLADGPVSPQVSKASRAGKNNGDAAQKT
jgi:colicin import membrane protein